MNTDRAASFLLGVVWSASGSDARHLDNSRLVFGSNNSGQGPAWRRKRDPEGGFFPIIILIALIVWIVLLLGCAGRHAYSSTDRKIDPAGEAHYAGTRFFDGHYHDLYCKMDSNGQQVCRFEN
jgi:hypothetical protein